MRDLVVREALLAMARDAAKRFREVVAAGDEVPYDIREPGEGSPLPQYVPLTERFVREHVPLLHELDSFGAACAAIESADLAVPYLEEMGVQVPADRRRRAELACGVLLARMWEDSTDFSLDDHRLRAAIAELEANGDAAEGEIEVVVPLRGLRMEATRLDLASAAIVRADTVDVPAEARSSEASGGAGWEPTFLAVTRVHAGAGASDDDGEGPDPGTRAVAAFRTLVTTLRLFKAGGVGLGPHAWTRLGSGRWRRISTGAGKPRPGGYRLTEAELGELAGFSRAATARLSADEVGQRAPAGLERAIWRFEAGLERVAALDALNDYLLALRFVLEGGGPADLGLSMRVASLCAEPDRRSDIKSVIDSALALERELWSGEPPAANGAGGPAETALEVEELARAILKDAACGHLGLDLRATADEILLADGLAVGDGAAEQRGATAEWGDVEPEPDEASVAEPEPEPEPRRFERVAQREAFEFVAASPEPSELSPESPKMAAEPEPDGPRYGRDAPVVQQDLWLDVDEAETDAGSEAVQVIHQPPRIRIERTAEEEEPMLQPAHANRFERDPELPREESPVGKLLALHSAEREATATRVANLFPKPETTEWTVREISYDRSRRSNAGSDAS